MEMSTGVSLLRTAQSLLTGRTISKLYDKRDDFDLEIVIVPFLDGNIPRHARIQGGQEGPDLP